MDRLIMKDLLQWKDRRKRKPLLLTGVRQCGKTYICKQFGMQYFDNCAYINFEDNEDLASIFDHNFDIQRILTDLENLVLDFKIVPGKTLLIFDEIQACPRAITSLKYFCENMPQLHLIAAGSLLGVAIRRESVSFPVGKVDRLIMYPMSFKEFVQAEGGTSLLEGMDNLPLDTEIPSIYTTALERHLKNYYIVGGMPEVVESWTETHDYEEVERIQDTIIKDYESDFSKYAPIGDVPKIRQIWHSIPEQLAKENNKFVFSHVSKGLRAHMLEDALEWLIDAGLVYKQKLVEKPELPLSHMADDTYFKLFFADIGLLRKKAGVYYRTILNEDERYIRFKGALAENYVMSELQSMNIESWFWRSGNTAEVDFLIEYQGRYYPIEVKSAENTKAKSFHQFVSRYNPAIGIKMSMKNAGKNMDGKTIVFSQPLYRLYSIKQFLSQDLSI